MIVNPVIKDTVTFLRTSKETNQKLTEAEIILMPGGENPLHYHKTYAETFTAVEGTLGLRVGKKRTLILQPGESFTVQPMVLHSFFNPSDEKITFNVKIQPGHTGFEYSLRIIYGLATDGKTDKKSVPKNIQHLAIVACMSDMNIPGFFTIIFPLLKWLANRAKANGLEQRLIDRYCI